IRVFEKAARDSKDPQLKAWAQQTLPTLREHLAQAKTLPGGGSKEPTTGAVGDDPARPTGGVAATGAPGGAGAGDSAATTAPPAGSERIRQAQQQLKGKGLDVGSVDGVLGPKTEAAVRNFQQQQGIDVTGQLDAPTLAALGLQDASGSSDRSSTMPPSDSPA